MSGIADAPWVGHCGDGADVQDEERKAYCFCDVCGEVIYEGDQYYKIGYDNICADCISNAKRTAKG